MEGKISGKLIVNKTLTVKAAANISGDVVVGKLSIEPGATFNATCAMKTPKPTQQLYANNGAQKPEKKLAK